MVQLKGYIDQLRSLTPPDPQRIQAVDGGGFIDSRLQSGEWGPFDNVTEFNKFFGHEYIKNKYSEYRAAFDKVEGRKWRVVFAHGDLGPHNILWRDGKIVAIIDWQCSGWLPEYWEYAKSWYGSQTSEWWELFRRVMDRYDDELEVEHCIGAVVTRL